MTHSPHEPCSEHLEDLTALHMGELPDDDARTLRAHADDCAGCAAVLRRLADVRRAVQSLPQVRASAELPRRVLEQVRAERERSRVAAPAGGGIGAFLRSLVAGPVSRRGWTASLAVHAALFAVLLTVALQADAPSGEPRAYEVAVDLPAGGNDDLRPGIPDPAEAGATGGSGTAGTDTGTDAAGTDTPTDGGRADGTEGGDADDARTGGTGRSLAALLPPEDRRALEAALLGPRHGAGRDAAAGRHGLTVPLPDRETAALPAALAGVRWLAAVEPADLHGAALARTVLAMAAVGDTHRQGRHPDAFAALLGALVDEAGRDADPIVRAARVRALSETLVLTRDPRVAEALRRDAAPLLERLRSDDDAAPTTPADARREAHALAALAWAVRAGAVPGGELRGDNPAPGLLAEVERRAVALARTETLPADARAVALCAAALAMEGGDDARALADGGPRADLVARAEDLAANATELDAAVRADLAAALARMLGGDTAGRARLLTARRPLEEAVLDARLGTGEAGPVAFGDPAGAADADATACAVLVLTAPLRHRALLGR